MPTPAAAATLLKWVRKFGSWLMRFARSSWSCLVFSSISAWVIAAAAAAAACCDARVLGDNAASSARVLLPSERRDTELLLPLLASAAAGPEAEAEGGEGEGAAPSMPRESGSSLANDARKAAVVDAVLGVGETMPLPLPGDAVGLLPPLLDPADEDDTAAAGTVSSNDELLPLLGSSAFGVAEEGLGDADGWEDAEEGADEDEEEEEEEAATVAEIDTEEGAVEEAEEAAEAEAAAAAAAAAAAIASAIAAAVEGPSNVNGLTTAAADVEEETGTAAVTGTPGTGMVAVAVIAPAGGCMKLSGLNDIWPSDGPAAPAAAAAAPACACACAWAWACCATSDCRKLPMLNSAFGPNAKGFAADAAAAAATGPNRAAAPTTGDIMPAPPFAEDAGASIPPARIMLSICLRWHAAQEHVPVQAGQQ